MIKQGILENTVKLARRLLKRAIGIKYLQDEYLNWLCFANAGMLEKGNLYCFDYAIRNLPSDSPVVEIGSFCGLSTNAINYLLKKNHRKNKIFSCDRWDFVGAESNTTVGDSDISHAAYRKFVKESHMRNIKMFSDFNLPYSIEVNSDDFFKIWEESREVSDIFGRRAKLGGPISFCYIDGNHSFEYVKRDFNNVDRFLEKGGFVFFDDSSECSELGSSRFMREVMKNRDYKLIMKNPNCLFQKIK